MNRLVITYGVKHVVLMVLMFTQLIAHAGDKNTALSPSVFTMTPTQMEQLSEARSKQFDLEPSEYLRYLKLMQGQLGFWNPSIDPMLALGLFAETEADENKYAEQYAQFEHDMTVRTLRFQRAYRDAFYRLYPDAAMTDQALLAPYVAHRQAQRAVSTSRSILHAPQILEGDRLRLFVNPSCQNCLSLIERVMKKTAHLSDFHLDIFVLQAVSDKAVRRWAKEHAVNRQAVLSQRITLNQDGGLLAKLRQRSHEPQRSLPVFFLQRGSDVFQLRLDDYGR